MTWLEKRIPPFLLLLMMATIMWLISFFSNRVLLSDPFRIALPLVILVLGCCLSIAGMVSFKFAETTVNPLKPHEASSLVIGGVYRWTRNPMYLGFTFILLAWAFYLSSPITFLGVIAFVWYLNQFQIIPEERALTALFGEEFLVYRSQVRRWL